MPERNDIKDSHEDKGKSVAEGEKKGNKGKKDSWSDDQKNRRYYYDDSSNYQIYLPDDEDEEDEPDK
ncbi:MAG TPA: hypothetical protein VF556_12255 [Pyrinomonadaceae bacterium]|jgi:hypothetical protein